MTFYERMAATALALLTKYGGPVTLRVVTQSGAYDPDTGGQATTNADTVYKGALFDFADGVTEVQGQLVAQGDKELLLDPTAAPTVKDLIIVGGVQYSILSVKELKPAGTLLLSKLHLRK